MSYSVFFRNQEIRDTVDSNSESEESGNGSLEGISKPRVLTEVERLEEVQTTLEESIKETKKLLQRQDLTRKQRQHALQKQRRFESKLGVLLQRLQLERTGRTRWTYVRRRLGKPRVGCYNSKQQNPLGPSAKFSDEETSPVAPTPAVVEEQVVERRTNEFKQERGKHLSRSQQLQKLHLAHMQGMKQGFKTGLKSQNNETDKAKDGRSECNESRSDEKIPDPRKRQKEIDREDIDKGRVGISDKPENFVKRTEQCRDALVSIPVSGMRRYYAKNSQGLSISSKNTPLRHSEGKNSPKNVEDSRKVKEKSKHIWTETRSVTSNNAPPSRLITRRDVTRITTCFCPPIPKFDAKKRPRKELIEKARDENDVEQNQVKIILIPNRQRVAQRRFLMYVKQLEFSKSHKLDRNEILNKMENTVKENDDLRVQQRHRVPTSRKSLYLIGALSKDHLSPKAQPR